MFDMKAPWTSRQRSRVGSKARNGDVHAKPVPEIAATPNFLCGSIRNREIATAGEVESGNPT